MQDDRARVYGTVTDEARVPLRCHEVHVEALSLRGKASMLACGKTDDEGRYDLEYEPTCDARMRIRVSLRDPDGEPIDEREILEPASVQRVDFRVGAALSAPAPVFAELHARLSRVLGDTSLVTLDETALARASLSAGVLPSQAAAARMAAVSASETGLPEELFFALHAGDLSSDVFEAVGAPPAARRRAVDVAIQRGTLTARQADTARNALEALDRWALELAMESKGTIATPGLAFELAGIGEAGPDVLALWHELAGDAAAFWKRVDLADDQRERLTRVLRLSALTRHHASLVASLFREHDSFEDVARLEPSDWEQLVARHGPPPHLGEGGDAAGYAAKLFTEVEDALPTAMLAARSHWFRPADSLQIFLSANPGYDLRGASLREHLRKHPGALDAVPEGAQREAVREELPILERLYRISPAGRRFETMRALRDAGVVSATQIQLMGRSQFLARTEKELGTDAARKVFRSARAVTAAAVSIRSDVRAATSATTMAVLPRTFEGTNEDERALLTDLFGGRTFCACEACQAADGPAAYFADLVFWVRGRHTGGDHWARLKQRRPDLETLLLSCKNTNTAMPSIDLLIEKLEDLLAGKDKPPARQTTWDTEDLFARPEHVHPSAYSELASEGAYPFDQPYVRWLEEVRMLLSALGVERGALMLGVAGTDVAESLLVPEIMAEVLGMNRCAWTILSGAQSMRLAALYGMTDAATALLDVPAFMVRAGIRSRDDSMTYADVEDLVRSEFVQGAGELAIAFDNPVCDVAGARWRTSAFEEHLTRIARLLRLRHSLGWSVAELDRAIVTFRRSEPEGPLDSSDLAEPLLTALTGVVWLERTLGVSRATVLDWFGPMDTRRWAQRVDTVRDGTRLERVPRLDSANAGGPDAEPSPFQRAAAVFDSRSPDETKLFAVRDDGRELVDTGALIASHLDAVAAVTSARPEEIGILLAAPGALPKISLSTLSQLRRQVTFARAIGLDVEGLLRWQTWTGIDPFVSPHDAIRLTVEVQRQRGVSLDPSAFAQLLAAPGTRALDAMRLPSAAEAFLALSEEHRAHARAPRADRERAIIRRAASMLEVDVALLDGLLALELNGKPVRHTVLELAEKVYGMRGENPAETADLAAVGDMIGDPTAWEMVALSGWIARAFDIRSEDVRWLIDAPSATRGFDLEDLLAGADLAGRYRSWAALREAARLRAAFEKGRVFDLLGALLDGSVDAAALREALAGRTGWPLAHLEVAIGDDFDGPLGGGSAAAWCEPRRLGRLVTWMNLAARLGVAAEPLLRWGSPQWSDENLFDPVGTYQQQAAELEQALVALLGRDGWRARMPALREALREETRAALVSRIVGVPGTLYHDGTASEISFESADALGQYLLSDPEMGACARTSRLNDATRTVQTFVQRVLLGEEDGLRLTDDEAEEWKWRKSFRVWQANRKVFLYPENWIRPELLTDRTPLYQTLIDTLAQGDLSDELVESAYREYLRGLSTVSRLEVLAMLREPARDGGVETYHVFARTQGAPRAYYHRTWVDGARWTPWERVVDVEGDHLIPAFFQGRLILFWLNIAENTEVPAEVSGLKEDEAVVAPPRYFEIHLSYSELRDGQWSPPVRSDTCVGLDSRGRFSSDKAKIIATTTVFDGMRSWTVEPRSLIHAGLEVDSDRDLRIRLYHDTKEGATRRLPYFVFSSVDGSIRTHDLRTQEGRAFPSTRPSSSDASSYVGTEQRFLGKKALSLPFPTSGRGADANETQAVLAAKAKTGSPPIAITSLFRKDFDSTDPFVFADPAGSYWVTLDHIAHVSTEREPRLDAQIPGLERGGAKPPEPFPRGMIVDQLPDAPMPTLTRGVDRSGANNLIPPDALQTLVGAQRLVSLNGQDVAPRSANLAVDTVVEVRNRAGTVLTKASTTSSSDEDLVVINMSAELPEMRPNGTRPPVNYVEDGAEIAQFRFRTFFHPHVGAMRETLNRLGVFGLLDPPAEERLYGQDPAPASTLEDRYDLHRVISPRPSDDLDFQIDGAYAQYNWELFFHAPFLIATRMQEAGRYLEALEWLHVIFDPHRSVDESGAVRSYWRFRPFRERFATDADASRNIRQLIALLSASASDADAREEGRRLLAEIAAWRRNPFDPHAIARTRVTAYMAAVAMRYVDVLLDYGDHLFAQFTLESVAEATELFLLAARILGPRPAPVDVAGDEAPTMGVLLAAFDRGIGPLETVEESMTEVWETLDDRFPAEADSLATLLYFCVPPNDYIESHYWDRVADRLFKIRHCLDIEGRRRDLALFAPPIDPELLVRAAATGVDLQTLLGEVTVEQVPHRRYAVLAEVAASLAASAQALGQGLMGAIERRDADQLQRLQALHERSLHDDLLASRTQELEEAREQAQALRHSREGLELQLGFYKDKPRTNPKEDAERSSAGTAKDLSLAAATASGLATVLGLVPLLDGGVAGAGGTAKVSVGFGGPQLAAVASATASMLNTQAGLLDRSGRMQLTEAGYDRRAESWKLQADMTEKELLATDRRIAATDIRVALAERALATAQKRKEQLVEIRDVLERRFGREELFDWMASQLAGLHFQSYQLAYETAKQAERAWAYELGAPADFIRFGYWDSRRKGLLAAERLGHDLRRMQVAYLDETKRRPEIEQTFSLREIDPVALVTLQETGEARFSLPEAFFDLYYPGHYRRRIRAARFTIPAVVPPGINVPAMLELGEHAVRTKPTESEADLVTGGFADAPVTAIATSSAQRDGGAFDLDFQSPRLLPFEGAGAVSSWTISLPKVARPFRYRDIQDVLVHLAYDAEYDGALRVVLDKDPSPVLAGLFATSPPRRRVISFRQELGSALRQLRASPLETPVRFELDPMTLPSYLGRALVNEAVLVLRTSEAGSANTNTVRLRLNGSALAPPKPWTDAPETALMSTSCTGAIGDLLRVHELTVLDWGALDPEDPELDLLLMVDFASTRP